MLNDTMSDDEPILSHSSEGEESEIDDFVVSKRPLSRVDRSTSCRILREGQQPSERF